MPHLPFGIYHDKDLKDVPKDYLVYLSRQEWFFRDFPKLFNAVIAELDEREKFEVE